MTEPKWVKMITTAKEEKEIIEKARTVTKSKVLCSSQRGTRKNLHKSESRLLSEKGQLIRLQICAGITAVWTRFWRSRLTLLKMRNKKEWLMLFQAFSSWKMLVTGQESSTQGSPRPCEEARHCSHSSLVCFGWETVIWLWLVYTTAKIVTSSLCFSIMLTYLGSSGHTPQKPLMTL